MREEVAAAHAPGSARTTAPKNRKEGIIKEVVWTNKKKPKKAPSYFQTENSHLWLRVNHARDHGSKLRLREKQK